MCFLPRTRSAGAYGGIFFGGRLLALSGHEVQRQRLARMKTKAGEYALEIMADGVRAQPEPLRDGFVGESFRREQSDLGLAATKSEGDPQLAGSRQLGSQ